MWQKFCIGLGRVFLGYIFLVSGIDKIFNWSGVHEGVSAKLSDWQAYVTGLGPLEGLFDVMVGMPGWLLAIAVALEMIGGLSVVFGYRVFWGSLMLIIFLIPTTMLYHQFWFLDGYAREEQLMAFSKNMALLGGLIILWASTSLLKRLEAHTK